MTNETLGLGVSRRGDTAYVHASGQLDLATVDDFRDAVRDARDGATELCIDLTRLEFIDSLGLTALLDIRHQAQADGVAFGIRVEDGPVRSAFELTGLGDLLNV